MLTNKDLNLIATVFFITILGHSIISFLLFANHNSSDPFDAASEMLMGGFIFYLLSNIYLYFGKIKNEGE